MTELMKFETAEGGQVVVEVSEQEPGVHRAARSGGVVEVRRRFEEALTDVRDAALSALAVFRDGRLQPDEVEMEFGVRLNAEAGAVIAKTTVEGHLVVKLTWSRTS
ncbi:CU044_2847 family protein [Nonomuraea sp. NPDC048881]|uniref:CU044_2847 family protein n=1 Tax=unclassified Nonomuraea TaxID=2593643 RepID=UPI0033F8B514